MHIVMLAAENAALPGAKVGGIADVIRDVPPALARQGHHVTVLTPGYMALSKLPGARYLHSLTVEFAGTLTTLELYEVPSKEGAQVRHLVLEHPLFAVCGAGQIYCHDAFEPFATDASKFALFSLAAAHAVVTQALGQVDVLHLHDWHAALVLVLRRFHKRYRSLQALRCVFTVHNLSLQGIRPWRSNLSSLEHWLPALHYEPSLLVDPRYPDCLNLMRCGLNLADQVHVVSPRYAQEILLPSDSAQGLIRGEGLEADLQRLHKAGKLHGILNGCDYPTGQPAKALGRTAFLQLVQQCLLSWVGHKTQITASWFHAVQRLHTWQRQKQREDLVLASIGRLTAQKVSLLQQPLPGGGSTLDALLQHLTAHSKGCVIMLGSGDGAYEQFMTQVMLRHKNFLFLAGYSEELSSALYSYCDAFLMPSSFEPCGISQLLALRAGKPVLVHAVGGLADTVSAGVNGFSFSGANALEQAQNLLESFGELVRVHGQRQAEWVQLSRNAAAARFSWDSTVLQYLSQLYGVSANE